MLNEVRDVLQDIGDMLEEVQNILQDIGDILEDVADILKDVHDIDSRTLPVHRGTHLALLAAPSDMRAREDSSRCAPEFGNSHSRRRGQRVVKPT